MNSPSFKYQYKYFIVLCYPLNHTETIFFHLKEKGMENYKHTHLLLQKFNSIFLRGPHFPELCNVYLPVPNYHIHISPEVWFIWPHGDGSVKMKDFIRLDQLDFLFWEMVLHILYSIFPYLYICYPLSYVCIHSDLAGLCLTDKAYDIHDILIPIWMWWKSICMQQNNSWKSSVPKHYRFWAITTFCWIHQLHVCANKCIDNDQIDALAYEMLNTIIDYAHVQNAIFSEE